MAYHRTEGGRHWFFIASHTLAIPGTPTITTVYIGVEETFAPNRPFPHVAEAVHILFAYLGFHHMGTLCSASDRWMTHDRSHSLTLAVFIAFLQKSINQYEIVTYLPLLSW